MEKGKDYYAETEEYDEELFDIQTQKSVVSKNIQQKQSTGLPVIKSKPEKQKKSFFNINNAKKKTTSSTLPNLSSQNFAQKLVQPILQYGN